MSMRAITFFTICLTLAITPSAQVDYFTVASEADLLDGGVLAEVEIDCMDSAGGEPFVFYNEATGDLVVYDPSAPAGSRTTIIRSNSQIDTDFGGDVTDCRALSIDIFTNSVYAVLSVGNVDSIYKTDLTGSFGTVLGEADGTTGLDIAQTSGLLVLARVEFFGAPEDGLYSMATDGTGNVPVAIATHPDLDLYDVSSPYSTRFYAMSSEFGGPGFQNVVVRHIVGSSEFEVVADPFADGTFTNGTDGGLEDLEVGTILAYGPQLYMFNNSFDAPGGEQWGFSIEEHFVHERFAEESALLADPDVTISGYDAPDGTHMSQTNGGGGSLYFESTSAFGGEDAILGLHGAPIPVELISFNAVVDGQSVTLNWETASETNNAGFEVQMRQRETWNALGFVEGHGTTTEAQQYSYSAELLPGTYTFRLKQIDFDGQFEYFGNVEATVGTPSTHLLSAVYPNPFNPQASFDLAVAQTQHVSIELYNVLGQRVATLFDATMEADANQTFTIDGAGLATGPYVVRVTGERFAESRTVTLLK